MNAKIVEKLLIIQILTLVLFTETQQREEAHLIFVKVECEILSNKLKVLHCYKGYKMKRSMASVELEYKEDIYKASSSLKMDILQPNQRTMTLYNVKWQFCKSVSAQTRRSLLQTIYKRVMQSAVKIPEVCPFRKDIPMTFKDFYLDSAMIPNILPEFNFTATLRVFSGSEQLWTMRANGTLCKTQTECQKYL